MTKPDETGTLPPAPPPRECECRKRDSKGKCPVEEEQPLFHSLYDSSGTFRESYAQTLAVELRLPLLHKSFRHPAVVCSTGTLGWHEGVTVPRWFWRVTPVCTPRTLKLAVRRLIRADEQEREATCWELRATALAGVDQPYTALAQRTAQLRKILLGGTGP